MSTKSNRLDFQEKLGYGLGDTASNFFFQVFNIFLLYYYTDVIGIPAVAIGTMFLVTKLWDAVNDPLMGIIGDRTQTRFGKFRPYILWMAVPYGVLGYAMFANPDLSENGKLVYAWVTYSLMMMAYTAINVPYSALMGVISPSSEERTLLSSYRFVCAFGGGLLISMLVRPMIRYFGSESEAQGFSTTMAIFAVVSIALFWYTFATTKERVKTPIGQSSNIKKDLAHLAQNKPWIVMFFVGIFTLTNVAVKNAVTIYYFKYYVRDDNSAYFLFFDRTSLFMTLGMLAMIAGVACTKFLANRFEKRSLMIVLSLLNAISMLIFYIIPPDQYWLMMAVNIVGTFIVGPTPALVWSMFADVADYSEWKNGRRATGLIFSGVQFAQKFGLTIGAGLSAWLLAAFGFVPNVDQTETAMGGIRLMFTVIPAAFGLLNVVTFFFYKLSDSQVQEIEKELAARKSENSTEAMAK